MTKTQIQNNLLNENKGYLSEQIITYIGNKRSLLTKINSIIQKVKKELKLDKLNCADLFSGSGIVARLLKQHAENLYVNDLENYAYTINKCYLMNKSAINNKELDKYYNFLIKETSKELNKGFISEMYAPQDDKNIKQSERVFYTTRNANFIDTERKALKKIPDPYKTLFLATLIYEASNKTNTSGVFKGFYKNSQTKTGQYGGNGRNALKRILSDIEIKKPILSSYECSVHIFKEDTNKLAKKLPILDFVYLDPPYNQHPYSSNYFMLNLINNYQKPKDVSKISGIPEDWNKSDYNQRSKSLTSLESLIKDLKAKYVLISFNSEGFISYDKMIKMLGKYGKVQVYTEKYNVYRGCRNLDNRDIHNKEYLFLLRKD